MSTFQNDNDIYYLCSALIASGAFRDLPFSAGVKYNIYGVETWWKGLEMLVKR